MITVQRGSVRRSWLKSGQDEFWLELRPDSRAAINRAGFRDFGQALIEVDDIFEDREGGETLASTLGPHGFVFLTHGVHSENVLDNWLAVLVEHFERHGLSGTLRAARQARELNGDYDVMTDGLTVPRTPDPSAFIAWPVDKLPDLRGYRSRSSTWGIDLEATKRIADRIVRWAQIGGPKINITRDFFHVETTDLDDAITLFADAVQMHGSAYAVHYRPGRPRQTITSFHRIGETVLHLIDPDESWERRIGQLRDGLVDLAGLLTVAFIRPAPALTSWWGNIYLSQALPDDLPEVAIRSHFYLLDRYVPDAHGIQILQDAHLQHASDLTRWNVTDLGAGRHLVEARDLSPWYSTPLPDPTVVEQARRDFGAMVLSRETIVATLPDWWDGPNPPVYERDRHWRG